MSRVETGIGASQEGYAAKVRIHKIIRTIVCVLLCILSIFPFYVMIVNTTLSSDVIKTGIHLIPGTKLIDNFTGMLERTAGKGTNVWQAMLHSVIISVPATVLQVYFAIKFIRIMCNEEFADLYEQWFNWRKECISN